jgi:hypothetical protein
MSSIRLNKYYNVIGLSFVTLIVLPGLPVKEQACLTNGLEAIRDSLDGAI